MMTGVVTGESEGLMKASWGACLQQLTSKYLKGLYSSNCGRDSKDESEAYMICKKHTPLKYTLIEV